MRRLADDGVSSYKLFMAYPGAMLSDDGTIFRTMRKAGEDGTHRVHARRERHRHRRADQDRALAEGHIEPKYHALTRPTRLEAEGTHRALAIAEVARSPVYIVHLSCYDALQELQFAPRTRGRHGPRRDLPAVSAPRRETPTTRRGSTAPSTC